jgi:hypothetical protein
MIVPVLIKNTYNMNLADLLFQRRKVEIVFGIPFQYKDVASENDDLREAASKIMARVCSME